MYLGHNRLRSTVSGRRRARRDTRLLDRGRGHERRGARLTEAHHRDRDRTGVRLRAEVGDGDRHLLRDRALHRTGQQRFADFQRGVVRARRRLLAGDLEREGRARSQLSALPNVRLPIASPPGASVPGTSDGRGARTTVPPSGAFAVPVTFTWSTPFVVPLRTMTPTSAPTGALLATTATVVGSVDGSAGSTLPSSAGVTATASRELRRWRRPPRPRRPGSGRRAVSMRLLDPATLPTHVRDVNHAAGRPPPWRRGGSCSGSRPGLPRRFRPCSARRESADTSPTRSHPIPARPARRASAAASLTRRQGSNSGFQRA